MFVGVMLLERDGPAIEATQRLGRIARCLKGRAQKSNKYFHKTKTGYAK